MISSSFKVIPGDSLNLKIADMKAGAEFVNLGTTVEVKPAGGNGGTMTVDGTQYTMRQFHFHLPSEHLDAGTQRAMEMHMVFESSDSQLAVIGTYIDVVGAAAENTTGPRCGDSASKAARRQATADQAKGHGLRFRSLENRQKGSNSTGTSPLLETVLSNVGEIAKTDAKMTTPPLVMSEVVSLLSQGDFQRYVLIARHPPQSSQANNDQLQRIPHHAALQRRRHVARVYPEAQHPGFYFCRRTRCHCLQLEAYPERARSGECPFRGSQQDGHCDIPLEDAHFHRLARAERLAKRHMTVSCSV
jgi:hypothetical protein